MTALARAIAVFFGAGLLRPGPGTWGSAVAVLVGYLIHALTGFPGLVVATAALFPVGWWAVATAGRATGRHDPGEYVVDEVVGQWVALLPVSGGFWFAGLDPWAFPWPGWVTAFVAFRVFDIWKPGLVGWADRRTDALGVMLDDVIAGAMAAAVVFAGAGLYHGVLAR